MSTTAATQAIKDYNLGINNNVYCPKTNTVDHDLYDEVMKKKVTDGDKKCQS